MKITVAVHWIGLVLCTSLLPALGPTRAVYAETAAHDAESTPYFAVMDFAVPLDLPGLAWARRGFPDLLMVALSHHGLEVLDREFVRQVMSELSLTEHTRSGHLLGADFVISGRVMQPETDRILVEASVTDVERLETLLSVSRAGAYPDDMDDLMHALTDAILQSVAGRVKRTAPQPDAQVSKPEAMICFYKGLATYAEGYPEAAVAWFISAHHLDPHLTGAKAWESRALEAAGFASFAERVRNEQESIFRSAPEKEGGRALALTRPMLLPAREWTEEEQLEMLAAMAAALKDRDDVSLINPEGLEQTIREHDHQLSGYFAHATMARYGQWRIPDGILQFRIDRHHDTARLRTWIEDLLTGQTVVYGDESVHRRDLVDRIPDFLSRLLASWDAEYDQEISEQIFADARPMPDHVLQGLGFQHRAFAESLNERRIRGPSHEGWVELADAFRGLTYFSLYGLAIDYAIQSIDLEDPDSDLTLHRMWRWLHASGLNKQEVFNNVASPDLLASIETNLLTLFPSSVCAGILWYEKGRIAWEREESDKAIACMREALAILQPGQGYTLKDRVILYAMYIKGVSLGRQGNTAEALIIFEEVQRRIDHYPDPATHMLTGVAFTNERRIAGGSGRELDLRMALDVSMRTYLSAADPGKEPIARFTEYAEQTNQDFPLCESRRDFILSALNNLIQVWDIKGPLSVGRHHDTDLARRWLNIMSYIFSEEERRGWFPSFIAAYAKREQLTTSETLHEIPLDDLWPHIQPITRLYFTVKLREDGLALVDRFLEPTASPERGLELLEALRLSAHELDDRLESMARWLPEGEKDIPGSLWMRLATLYVAESKWGDAATALGAAFTSKKPATPGDDGALRTNITPIGPSARVVMNQGLDRDLDNPFEATRNACFELGVLPWMPSWWDWHNEGRIAHEDMEYERAVACYRTALQFLEDPSPLDPDITISLSPQERINYGRSTKFHMALSFLLLDRHDEAALLLREIALETSGEIVGLHGRVGPRGQESRQVRLGVVASQLLHCIHLIHEAELQRISDEDRDAAVRALLAMSDRLHNPLPRKFRPPVDPVDEPLWLRAESQYLRDAAKRLER